MKASSRTLCVTGAIVIGAGFLVYIFANAWMLANWRGRSLHCTANMHQIAHALSVYHDFYGALPPTVIRGEHGEPLHSWRALIHWFADEGFRNRYLMSEPWDGPNNRQLLDNCPPYLSCPNLDQPDQHCPYLALSKDDRFLVLDTSQQSRNSPDRRVLVIESRTRAVPWLQPVDYDYDESVSVVAESHDTPGPSVVLSDYSVHLAPPDKIPTEWLPIPGRP